MAINFPSSDGPEVVDGKWSPPDSNIVYFWDPGKQSWLLLPTAETSFVNKDYVDYNDELKYDKLGGRISGDVSVSEFGSNDTNIGISGSGTLSFHSTGDSRIVFDDTQKNTVSVDGLDIFKIHKEEVKFYSTLTSYNSSKPIISYNISNSVQTQVTILQTPVTNSSIKNVIGLNNSGDSSFVIQNPNTDSVFSVSGSGVTEIKSNNETLKVSRLTGPNQEVFSVNPKDYKITASDEYNLGLVNKTRSISSTDTTDGTYTYSYEDDKLLATLGVVKKYQYTPGQAVFAESEAETEINGLWTDGTNYYIKYK